MGEPLAENVLDTLHLGGFPETTYKEAVAEIRVLRARVAELEKERESLLGVAERYKNTKRRLIAERDAARELYDVASKDRDALLEERDRLREAHDAARTEVEQLRREDHAQEERTRGVVGDLERMYGEAREETALLQSCYDSHTPYIKGLETSVKVAEEQRKTARASERRLREALEKHGKHGPSCSKAMPPYTECSCGLSAALAEHTPVDGEEKG